MKDFKGMTYDEIMPIFEKQGDFNQAFLAKDSEEIHKEEVEVEKVKEDVVVEQDVEKEPIKEYQLLGRMEAKDMEVYKLTRADGSSSYHGDLQAFFRRLDRQDMHDLYRLVQERFQTTTLEGHDLILWGDLKMIFEPDEGDEVWRNQQDWKLMKWKLHENCGVHSLLMWGTPMEINMLVEKEYPLIKDILEKMLRLQLEAEEESTMALELIKFIKSQIEE
ncbi:hypothetical protein Tco_1121096 [Tanacetum coccineum]|uniref:Uncharacterized protein n=1 Tax=Tanacetum coccineum TaxID=301880 RepID=A0ABQ5IX42_9ASTR